MKNYRIEILLGLNIQDSDYFCGDILGTLDKKSAYLELRRHEIEKKSLCWVFGQINRKIKGKTLFSDIMLSCISLRVSHCCQNVHFYTYIIRGFFTQRRR